MTAALQTLAAALQEQGGLIGAVVQPPDASGEGNGASPAALAASGPLTREHSDTYAFVFEAIYEGYLLHYRRARIVRTDDADLGLLAGDRLYALGLARLVALGDLDAVRELADVISLTALAHAGGDDALAEAIWLAGARAVGWGGGGAHERAKELVRSGSPDAVSALRALAAA